jgi:trimeric autotransporter adhesin
MPVFQAFVDSRHLSIPGGCQFQAYTGHLAHGNVTTNAAGEAIVTLPEWFETLNRDFRYQLTVMGQFAQAIVASKVANHRFSIKSDKPNVEVSWQVTGIRQDAWANAHRIPVEEQKSAKERGSYLNPELFGAPEEKGVLWARDPQTMMQWKQTRMKLASHTQK